MILERTAPPAGSLGREFGRGWLVGPAVAPDEAAAALAVIAPPAAGRAGGLVRVDTVDGDGLAELGQLEPGVWIR